MKINTLTISAIIIVLMISCHKGHNGLVEGYVKVSSTNLPAKNIKITVSESYGFNSDLPLTSSTTDENGYYKIYYDHKIFHTYHQFVAIKNDTISIKK